MNINKLEKIIRLHLDGFSNRKIAEEVGLSHQAIADAISGWREQKYEIYRDAIPLEEEIIELAKYRRDKKIRMEELTNVLLLSHLIKDLGLNVENVFNVAQYLKNLPADERNSFLESAKIAFEDLKKKNLTYKDLSQLIFEKKESIKELDKRIADLNAQAKRIEEHIKKLSEDEKNAGLKLEEINKEIEEKNKKMEEMEKSIAIGKKYENVRTKIGLNDDEFFKFIENAEGTKYDLKMILKLDELEAYAKRYKLNVGQLEGIIESIRDLEAHGIKITYVPALREKLREAGYSINNLESMFFEFIINDEKIRSSKKKEIELLEQKGERLKKENERLEDEIENKKEELGSLSKNLETANEFKRFLEEQKITESDFASSVSLFKSLGYSTEKLSEMKLLNDTLKEKGYTFNALIEDIKKSLECIQYKRDLDSFGLDVETLNKTRQMLILFKVSWSDLVSELLEIIKSKKRLNDINNEIKSAEEELKAILEKIGNVRDYQQILNERANLLKELDIKKNELRNLKKDLSEKYEELVKVTNGIKEYSNLADENKRLRKEKGDLEKYIKERKREIDAGLGIYELLKYTDIAKQQHLKDLAKIILEDYPFIPEALPSDLRNSAINALIEISKGGIVAKVYPSSIKIIRGEEYDANMENFMKIKEMENWVNSELIRFQSNCIKGIEDALRNGTMPERVMALVKKSIDAFVESKYNSVLKDADVKRTLNQLASTLSNILNAYLKLTGEGIIDINEKISISGIFDHDFRAIEIGIDEVIDALMNDRMIVREKYAAEWHKVLRSMVISKVKKKSMPMKFHRTKEFELPKSFKN
jgi:chromosome segregation ATPase